MEQHRVKTGTNSAFASKNDQTTAFTVSYNELRWLAGGGILLPDRCWSRNQPATNENTRPLRFRRRGCASGRRSGSTRTIRPSAKEFGLDVLCSDAGEHGVRIAVLPESKTLRVGKVNAPFELKQGEDLTLRVFLDKPGTLQCA